MLKKALLTGVALCLCGGALAAAGTLHPSTEATKSQPSHRPMLPGPFHGHGTKDLATIRAPRAEIVWTSCRSCKITISNTSGDPSHIRVNPRDRGKGYAFVAAGTYHHLTVHGSSAWTVRLEQALLLR